MEIRTATPADLAAVTALEAACFPPAEAAGEASFQARLAAFPDSFWLLVEGGRVLAMVNGMVTQQPDLTDAMYDDASLHDPAGPWQMIFGVAPPRLEHNGVISVYLNAGTLLRHAIQETRARGKAGLVLTCKEKLVPYYARFGFVSEGPSASQHGGAAWYQMRLRV